MLLDSLISELKGVGEQRLKCYDKLCIHTIRDLLFHYPRDYTDFSHTEPILQLPLEEIGVVLGEVVSKRSLQRIRKGLTIGRAVALDEVGEEFNLVFFNNDYVFERLVVGERYRFCGKVTGSMVTREMQSPIFISDDDGGGLLPQYPLTAGLTAAVLRGHIRQALGALEEEFLDDYLPQELVLEEGLCGLSQAVRNIHMPSSGEMLEAARKRLNFDELFLLQLGILIMGKRTRMGSGMPMAAVDLDTFYSALPFEPTAAQRRSIGEIFVDMSGDVPMNRMLQGDVGSGKTLVAAAAAYVVAMNGAQSAIMAPTEILASQHYETMLKFLSPMGVGVCLLTGSLSAKKKGAMQKAIADGAFSVAIGTHALVQEHVSFARLALVVTDEQHRFGVAQRSTLAQKGDNPHQLVMSATPIPRTLGLIVYGDLDISVLDELPAGRRPVKTFPVSGNLRERAFRFVKEQLDLGRQAYVVCPAIAENPTLELQAVETYHDKLEQEVFMGTGYRVGLLHGKMSGLEKDAVMGDFKSGAIHVLVSTTVVEVGVDVPNASVIVIENADRFGLSQLHQLRGRVGRGHHESFCILVSDNFSEECRERMKIMASTSDGFVIANEDMKLRGCGDFFGSRQHGAIETKLSESPSPELIAHTQWLARDYLERLKEFSKLEEELERRFELSEASLN